MICGTISIGVRFDPVFIIRDDRGDQGGGITGDGFEEILTIHVVPYMTKRGLSPQES